MRPSKIQAASLPKIWAGRELLAQSHNGIRPAAARSLQPRGCTAAPPSPQARARRRASCWGCSRRWSPTLGRRRSASRPRASSRSRSARGSEGAGEAGRSRERVGVGVCLGEEVLKMGKHMLAESGIRLKVILREERYESGAKMEEQLVVGTPGKAFGERERERERRQRGQASRTGARAHRARRHTHPAHYASSTLLCPSVCEGVDACQHACPRDRPAQDLCPRRGERGAERSREEHEGTRASASSLSSTRAAAAAGSRREATASWRRGHGQTGGSLPALCPARRESRQPLA